MEEQNWHINSRAINSETSFVDLYKRNGSKVDTFSNRHHHGFKIMGNKEPVDPRFKQIYVPSGDHRYIRISSQCNEDSGQFPVKSG